MVNSFLAPGLCGVEIAGKGGRGVFAEQPIPRGALLVVFGGDIITRKDVERLTPELRPLVIQVDEDCFLVSTKPGPADWVNHSCEPNAGIRGQITLVALRDIAPGEEITFDYAMSDGCDYDEFDCGCGARLCRGRVTGEDWRDPVLSERYRGFRSTYLDAREALEARHGHVPPQLLDARQELDPRHEPLERRAAREMRPKLEVHPNGVARPRLEVRRKREARVRAPGASAPALDRP